MGIVMARRIAIANPRGDGFRRACTRSCTAAMIFWMADVLLVELSPKLGSVGVVLCTTVGKASEQSEGRAYFRTNQPPVAPLESLGAQPRSLRKLQGPCSTPFVKYPQLFKKPLVSPDRYDHNTLIVSAGLIAPPD